MNSKRSAEGKGKRLSADMPPPLEEDDARAGANRSVIGRMELSDALFLDTLLYDSVESCPRHVWLWDEYRPTSEPLH